jgi:hypothetical protein
LNNEIIRYNSFCNKTSIKKAQVEQIIQKYNPGKEGLTFAQMYKVLTGITIDPNTDPYDGKLERK